MQKNRHKLRIIIIPTIFILGGSLLLFFEGYKDNGFVNVISLVSIFLGWVIVLLLFSLKKAGRKNEIKSYRRKIIAAFSYATFAVMLLCNLYVVDKLSNLRINSILANGRTKQVSAVVTRIEDRYTRGGWKPYAIISYEADGASVEKSLYNGNESKYLVGQTVPVIYSMDYPEMYAVIKK